MNLQDRTKALIHAMAKLLIEDHKASADHFNSDKGEWQRDEPFTAEELLENTEETYKNGERDPMLWMRDILTEARRLIDNPQPEPSVPAGGPETHVLLYWKSGTHPYLLSGMVDNSQWKSNCHYLLMRLDLVWVREHYKGKSHVLVAREDLMTQPF